MTSGEHKNLDYPQLIEALHRLCSEGRTGTMFICTDENQALRFVLENGRVVGCNYRRKHGREALPLIRTVRSGRYSFSEGMFMAEEVPMPDPAVFFQLLEGKSAAVEGVERSALQQKAAESPSRSVATSPRESEMESERPPRAASVSVPPPVESVPVPIAEVPASAPIQKVQAATAGIKLPTPEELQSLLERRLALLMGPIGPIIAGQYADAVTEVSTEEQLLDFIEQIRREIPDETQSLELRRMLLEDLR